MPVKKENKLTESALHPRERRFHILIDSFPQFLWEAGADGSGLLSNKRLLGYLDMSLEQIQGKGWLESVHPDDSQGVMEALNLAVRTGEEFSAEIRIRNGRTGEYRWFLTRAIPHRNQEGRISRWFGTCTDIQKTKLTEQSLRESEDRFRTILENLPGGVFVHDLDGKILTINDAAIKNTGYTKEELLEMSVADIDPESVTREDRTRLWHRLSKGGSITIESAHIRKDGSKYPTEIHLNAIELRGQPVILAIAYDITERNQAEQTIKQLNQTLEQRVAERTYVAESRSRQLQALAVELIEAEERERERIAGLLHDDLQQLLAGAKFTLQSSTHSGPDLEEVQSLLEESIRKSRRLSHELSPTVLHHSGLPAALKWLCMQMREQFGLKVQLTVTTARRVESTPLKVFLFRAVQELLFNIVKHAGVNTAQVDLAGSGDRFILTVRDCGKGFDTSILTTYRPKAGLGLLSLQERASYIGGRLAIKSASGQGSRITLTIPAIEAEAVQSSEDVFEELKIPSKPAKTAGGSGIRVLFADDHKVMRQGLIRLISGKPNVSVIGEAANGREALELAQHLRPDVIVMDISMPEMDGIEATKRVKAELPDIRVIGLSMHDDEHTSQAMLDAGAESFLSKAVSSSKLLKAIYGIKGQETR